MMEATATAAAKEPKTEQNGNKLQLGGSTYRKFNCFFQPNILVIDDNANPLLESVEQYMEEHYGYKAHFQVREELGSREELRPLISSADMVMLDHRINGKFVSFKSGVEIGLYIRQIGFEKPIVYYTAFPDDLSAARANKTLTAQWSELRKDNLIFFNKLELEPGKKLNELCNFIFEKTKVTQERLNIDGEEAIMALQDAQIEQIKGYRYEILDLDRRKLMQNLRCLSSLDMDVIDIPTRYLEKLGIKNRSENVMLNLVQFDCGQILSFFQLVGENDEAIASEVLALLEEK
jgi:hypothetical protein